MNRRERAQERLTLTLIERVEATDKDLGTRFAQQALEIMRLEEVKPETIHTQGYYALLALGEVE